MDEADRLLTQSFHDWLPSVLAALKSNAGGDSDKEIVEVEQHGARALAPEQWDSSVGRVASDVDVRVGSSVSDLLSTPSTVTQLLNRARAFTTVPKTALLGHALARPRQD